MSGINSSAWTPSEVIGGLTLAFAVLSAIGWLLYLIINDPADRRDIAAWLEKARLWEGYRRGVGWGLGRLERFYGGSFSWLAFDRCLLIALFYPIILYIVAWAAGGSTAPSGIFPFPSDWPWWERWFLTILVLCLGVLLASLGWNRDRIDGAARRVALRLHNRIGLSLKGVWIFGGAAVLAAAVVTYLATDSWGTAFLVTVFFLTALFISVTTVGLVVFVLAAGIATGFLTGMLCGLVAVALGLGAKVRGFGVAIVSTAIAVPPLYEIAEVGPRDPNVFVAWMFFFALLPIVNAVADYLSLGISRKLLRPVADNTGHWRLARHIGYDIVCAFILLFLLAGLLLSGAVVWAEYASSWRDVDLAWQTFIQAARDEPLGGGLLVTVMLFSTLVPTFAHLLVAAMALLIRPFPGQHTIAVWLAVDGDVQTSRKIGSVAWMMAVAAAGLAGLYAIGYGIWTLISFLTGDTIGEHLYFFATCSAALVSDVPCVTP